MLLPCPSSAWQWVAGPSDMAGARSHPPSASFSQITWGSPKTLPPPPITSGARSQALLNHEATPAAGTESSFTSPSDWQTAAIIGDSPESAGTAVPAWGWGEAQSRCVQPNSTCSQERRAGSGHAHPLTIPTHPQIKSLLSGGGGSEGCRGPEPADWSSVHTEEGS